MQKLEKLKEMRSKIVPVSDNTCELLEAENEKLKKKIALIKDNLRNYLFDVSEYLREQEN